MDIIMLYATKPLQQIIFQIRLSDQNIELLIVFVQGGRLWNVSHHMMGKTTNQNFEISVRLFGTWQ